MKSFLSIVAEDLLRHYGPDMRGVTVVFPGRRASLFLNQELEALSSVPVWAPRYTTMGELFRSLSGRITADPIDCICELYDLYIKYVGTYIMEQEGAEALERETLDRFWGWGEILMADLDDIDKHMADAQQVFRHIHDLSELQDLSYLDEHQKQVLARFFGYFASGRESLLRQRFIRLWDQMPAIYQELLTRMKGRNKLWEGALYREVCERIDSESDLIAGFGQVCFVGFNVLNAVEEHLMKALGDKARFYWDYDEYYTLDTRQEAGEFMRRNLVNFPSALPPEYFRNIRNLRELTLISCPTDNAASRYVGTWLRGPLDTDERQNAVVLCDERLLLPVLNAIPSPPTEGAPSNINVTMGFPLTETPVYSFLNILVSFQTDGWDERHNRFRKSFVQSVNNHPYARFIPQEQLFSHMGSNQETLLQWLIETVRVLSREFVPKEDSAVREESDIYRQLYAESLFQCHRVLMQLLQVISRTESPLRVSNTTLRRLMRTVLAGINIPFHGEPACGLQVMGVLETRCLDFSHLLMLSVEEGRLPRDSHQDSLLPPVVRESYGLTTQRHKVCIFAYYFYRLIQRTSHLTCIFNENCVGTQRHELSRFLRQLQAETPPSQLRIHRFRLQSMPAFVSPREIIIPKTPEIIQRLTDQYCRSISNPQPWRLSPTAINSYMRCPIQFYLRYVADLKPVREEADETDPSMLGSIFHDAAEILYTSLSRRKGGDHLVSRQDISDLLRGNELRRCVDESFRKHEITEYTGSTIIMREAIEHYLHLLLRADLHLTPFTMEGMETNVQYDISVPIDGQPINISVGGRIDRLDRLSDGTLRIIDYKTGSSHPSPATLEDVFRRGSAHPGYAFQSFLYAVGILMSFPGAKDVPVQAALFYVRNAWREDYNPVLSIKTGDNKEKESDIRTFASSFQDELRSVLAEIFSAGQPFRQTTDPDVCANCDFCLLCDRRKASD